MLMAEVLAAKWRRRCKTEFGMDKFGATCRSVFNPRFPNPVIGHLPRRRPGQGAKA